MSYFYTGTSSGTVNETASYVWASKTFTFDHEITLASMRVHYIGTAPEIKVYGQGFVSIESTNGLMATKTPTTSGAEVLFDNPLPYSKTFFFTVTGSAIVSRVEFFEQKVIDVKETTVITRNDIDTWRNFKVRYARENRPCYVYASALTTPVIQELNNGVTITNVIPRSTHSFSQELSHNFSIDSDTCETFTIYMRRTVKVPKHIHVANDGEIPPWLIERYQVPEKSRIASILTVGTGLMNLYYDGSVEGVQLQLNPGLVETVPTRTQFSSLEFDFNGLQGMDIPSVHIFLVEEKTVDGIITVDNPEHEKGWFFKFNKPNHFRAKKVSYADETTVIERILPYTDQYSHEFDFDTTGKKLHSFTLYPLIDEPNNGIIREEAKTGDCPPWEYKRYVFDKPRIITSFIVSGTTNTFQINGTTVATSSTLTSNQEIACNIGPTRYCEITTGGIRDNISAISVFTKEVIEVGENGFTKTGGDNWVNLYLTFPTTNMFVCGKVLGENATVTINDISITPLTSAAGIIKLPRAYPNTSSLVHRVSVHSTHPEHLTLLPRTVRPVNDKKVRILNDGFIPEWIHTTYELIGSDKLTSVYVKGNVTTMNFYKDGSMIADITVSDGLEVSLLDLNISCSHFEFDFDTDMAVTEVIFWADPMRIVGQDDIVIDGEDHWFGRRYKFPDRGEWACVSAGADAYPVDITLTGSPTGHAHSVELFDGYMVALDRDKPDSIWTLDIDAGVNTVYNFIAKARTRFPVNETVVRITGQEKEIHPWWYGRWDIPDDRKLTGIIVDADEYPIGLTLYATGANTTSESITIANNKEFRLTDSSEMRDVSSVDIKFNEGSEYKANEAFLIFQQERIVPTEGITLENEVSWRSLRFSFQEKNRFAVATVKAESYTSLKLTLYDGDGSLVETISVDSGDPFLMPITTDGTQWEVDIYYSGTTIDGNINSITLIPFQTKSIDSDTYVMKSKGKIAEWLYTRYEMPKKQRIRSVYVSTQVAESTHPRIVLTPYPGIASTTEITPYKETKLEIDPCGAFTFYIEDQSRALIDVDDIILHMERHVPIENRHTILRDITPVEGIRNRTYRFADTGSFSAIRVVTEENTLSTFTANASTNILTHNNTRIVRWMQVQVRTTNTLPAGLDKDTNYYVIKVSDTTLKLATTLINAQNEVAIDITDTGTGIHTLFGSEPIIVTPYADGAIQPYIEVTSNDLFDLDIDMPNAREWQIDIESNSIIRELMLVTKEEVPYNGVSWIITRDTMPFTWRHHRTIAPSPMEFSCARVVADVYPLQMQIYDMDNRLVYDYAVSDEKPFRLRREQKARCWRVDVSGAPDSRIWEVALSTSMEGLKKRNAST